MQILLLEFEHIAKTPMTLPRNGKKLDENEVESITNAVKEAGIAQIHPEKMEAFGEYLVSKLKSCSDTN